MSTSRLYYGAGGLTLRGASGQGVAGDVLQTNKSSTKPGRGCVDPRHIHEALNRASTAIALLNLLYTTNSEFKTALSRMDQSSVVKMGDLGFAFSDVEFSDRVLRIEVTSYDGSSSSTTTTVKVLTLNISSCLLASESAFFHKLLENDMGESDHLTLEINASEEAALMDLLNFMYINSLSATTIPDLMDVQMVAAKFEVISCMRYCSQTLPTPLDEYELDPPNPNSSVASVQALKDAAKKYLVGRFRDFTIHRSQEEAMALSLSALEVVLSSDGLRVNSEDDVFDFIVKWGIARYPKLEERREVLTKRLARLVHFPYISSWKLTALVLPCPHLDPEETWRLVWKSFQFHVGFPHGQRMLVGGRLIKRVYKYRRVKVIYLTTTPVLSCDVYLNLTKEECHKDLFRAREAVFSQRIFADHHRCFSLVAWCGKDKRTSLDHLCLFLHMNSCSVAEECTMDYEFQVMKRPSKRLFESKYKCDKYTFWRGKHAGKKNLLGIPWADFMSGDSEYFIDGVLHLRAQLRINPS